MKNKLQENKHTLLKITSYMHYIWILSSLFIIHYSYCYPNICREEVMEIITITIVPATIYFIISILNSTLIFQDKYHKDKFGTSKLTTLKMYSLILIIISIILDIANYSISYFLFVPAIILEIINYIYLKIEYDGDNNIETHIKKGNINKYIEEIREKENENKEK